MSERKFRVPTKEGVREVPLLHRFSHYIGGIQHWFAIHTYLQDPEPVLSEWYSGMRVSSLHFLKVGLNTINMTDLERAKFKLNQLEQALGGRVMHEKISAAILASNLNPKLT